MKCDNLKLIDKAEAYAALRELFLRMDKSTPQTNTSKTLAETAEEYRWALAMDRVLDAIDALGPKA